MKLKLINKTELAVSLGSSVYCDFCGEDNIEVFTSSFADESKCGCKQEMQICKNCVSQLTKFIK